LLNRLRRHEAALQQAVLQEIRNPLAILQIGLPAPQRLHLRWVGQQQLKLPFQYVPHRFPVDPGGFHRHMGHLIAMQPVG
jgi:hypothetical protein